MTWALAGVSVLLIVWAAVSGRLKSRNVTAAMFFTAAGLVVGPASGLLDLSVGSEQVKLVAEATLTLVLFADASRISVRSLRSEYTVPLRLLGLGLPLTIVAGALVGVAVLPGLDLAEALVLGVMLACTDAALGQAVVTDQRVPSRIRQGLNVESGLNDGLCVPLFFIAIALAETEDTATSGHHAATLVWEQIGYGLIGGVAAGLIGGVAFLLASRHRSMDAYWGQVLPVATAALAAGVATALGGSIFIAAFTAGFTFGVVRRGHDAPATELLDETGELLNAITFIIFGAVILGPALQHLTWGLVLYPLLSLTVVRMLPVAAAMLGTGARPPTLGFLGWFGPRGLASIVFGVILLDDTNLPHQQTLLHAVVLTVGVSVFAHGLTAGPLTRRYVRWYQAHPADAAPAMETVPAVEHRLRTPWTDTR
jgi:NhaP-type Na+/H+ or K+/H+ antiporter